MGEIESTIKSEIQRLAKHEVRTVFRPLRKEVWGIRLKLSNLLKGFAPLNRWVKETAQSKSKESRLAASPEEVKASRLTPERIRGLRKNSGYPRENWVFWSVRPLAQWLHGKMGNFGPGARRRVRWWAYGR